MFHNLQSRRLTLQCDGKRYFFTSRWECVFLFKKSRVLGDKTVLENTKKANNQFVPFRKKKKTITSFWGGFKICIDIFPDFLIFSWWFRLIWTSCVTRNSWRKKLPCISFHWIMAIHYVCGSSAWTTFLASFSGSRLQAVRKTDIVVGRGGVLGVSSLSQTIFLSS